MRTPSLFLAVTLTLLSACTRLPPVQQTPIKAATVVELQEYVREHKTELDAFRLRGPFAITEHKDRELRLSPKEFISSDFFLAAPPEKAPLVIFVHGQDVSKEAHSYQAMHLASWGMHCVTLQLPKKGPWDGNGRTLARIVRLIQRAPEFVDARIDVNKILLVGHSFGASAVATALSEGAPAVGAILLDPAAIGAELPKLLRRIDKPVLVLGADDDVVPTRNRDYFFDYIRGGVAELSVKDATHEDAQYPSESSLQNFGIDPDTTEDLQLTFVAALASGALSLFSTGAFDYAWTSFAPAFKAGKFFNAKKK